MLTTLLKIEKKRVKGVQDNLDRSEILWRLQRTETVINKLKQQETKYDQKMADEREIFPERLKTLPVTSMENINTLR